jgi:hypothetical protein
LAYIRHDYKYDATASKRASSLFSFYFPPGFLTPKESKKVSESGGKYKGQNISRSTNEARNKKKKILKYSKIESKYIKQAELLCCS